MKREFLMLSHDFDNKKHGISGMYMSEKLDGMRAYWDGGISRGLPCSEVPYAYTAKHHRFVTPPVATGLWSRYAQPIQAPDWWLDALPKVPLDGEMYAGRGEFQTVTSITRSLESPDWHKIKYMVFDSPSIANIFADGTITNQNMKHTFKRCDEWAMVRAAFLAGSLGPTAPFYKIQNFLKDVIDPSSEIVKIHEQIKLPASRPIAETQLNTFLNNVVEAGGEGIMLRNPMSIWNPIRSHDLLKLKPFKDSEATVIGYFWGKPTDTEKCVSGEATDRMLGLMGSILLNWNGKVFKLSSGFTLEDRRMRVHGDTSEESFEQARQVGAKYPGESVDNAIFLNPKFMIGSKITFKYRELTDDGLPKECRYWRKHVD